jgi:hypothetical protein
MARSQNGSKRAAATAAAPLPKRAKQAGRPTSKNADVDAIQNVLRNRAVDLPEVVRDMLIAMVPGSLGVPVDERQKFQGDCVAMIEETLAAVKAKNGNLIADEDVRVADVVNQKAALQAKVDEFEGSLQKQQEAVAARKMEVAEAKSQLSEATKSAAASVDSQREGDTDIEVAKQERDDIESMLDVTLKAVQEGSWETEKDAKKLVAQLVLVLKKIGLDASLITALPAACTKKPEAWGSFDSMVIEQVAQGLKSHSQSLASTLAAAAPAAAERAAAVTAAEAGVTAAQELLQAREAWLSSANKELGETQEALLQAKKAKKSVHSSVLFGKQEP